MCWFKVSFMSVDNESGHGLGQVMRMFSSIVDENLNLEDVNL